MLAETLMSTLIDAMIIGLIFEYSKKQSSPDDAEPVGRYTNLMLVESTSAMATEENEVYRPS